MIDSFTLLPKEIQIKVISNIDTIRNWQSFACTDSKIKELIKSLSLIGEAHEKNNYTVLHFWNEKAHPFTIKLLKDKKLSFKDFFNSYKKFNQVFNAVSERNANFSKTFKENPEKAFDCIQVGRKEKTVIWLFPPEIINTQNENLHLLNLIHWSGKNLNPNNIDFILKLQKNGLYPKNIILKKIIGYCRDDFIVEFLKRKWNEGNLEYNLVNTFKNQGTKQVPTLPKNKRKLFKKTYWKLATEGLNPSCYQFICDFLVTDIDRSKENRRENWSDEKLLMRFQKQDYWRAILSHCNSQVGENLIEEAVLARMNIYDIQEAINSLNERKKLDIQFFLFKLQNKKEFLNYFHEMEELASQFKNRPHIFSRCRKELYQPFARCVSQQSTPRIKEELEPQYSQEPFPNDVSHQYRTTTSFATLKQSIAEVHDLKPDEWMDWINFDYFDKKAEKSERKRKRSVHDDALEGEKHKKKKFSETDKS